MIFRPSALEEFLSKFPKEWQIIGLKAMKEEHDRWARGDLTEEEQRGLDKAKALGTAARNKMEQIALECFN